MSLGNVRWNRAGGVADLFPQAVRLLDGKVPRRAVHIDNKIHRVLPYTQVTMIADFSTCITRPIGTIAIDRLRPFRLH